MTILRCVDGCVEFRLHASECMFLAAALEGFDSSITNDGPRQELELSAVESMQMALLAAGELANIGAAIPPSELAKAKTTLLEVRK